MLYLFGSGAYNGDRKIVKVGFTDDIEERKTQYLLHNPLGEFIGIREGGRELELKLHLRLADWKVEFLDEWFYDEGPVQTIFGSTEDDIDLWIWNNRSEALLTPVWPKQGSLKYSIFDKLRKKYGGVSGGEKII